MEPLPKTSIIIRAYNEEKHIGRLLQGIHSQKTSCGFEVILVDSGSTDNTVTLALKDGAKVVRIAPADFSFGYALNKGIEQSKGELCVFISAHCYPENTCWLENLTRPFREDHSIALVYGKQRGNWITRYTEHQIFAKWFPDDGGGKQSSAFCNNANVAIRKALWHEQRYNEDLTGLEDIDWAKRILSKGYAIYYAPDAGIIHVHDETFTQVYRRYKREAMALREIYPQESFTFIDFMKLFHLNALSDYIHAYQDGRLFGNVMDILFMRFLQFLGTYRGHARPKPLSSDLKIKFYYPRRPHLFERGHSKGTE